MLSMEELFVHWSGIKYDVWQAKEGRICEKYIVKKQQCHNCSLKKWNH